MAHPDPNPPVLHSFSTSKEIEHALATFIIKAQDEALANLKKEKPRFTIALSGGSLPQMLGGLKNNPDVKWSKWHVYYADERAVRLDDKDSNHNACSQLLSDVPLENIHTIDAALVDNLLNAQPDDDEGRIRILGELADAYQDVLISEFARADAARFPVFDLILLGMGPDGHTASLFPGHELLEEKEDGGRWVAYIKDSVKPPPERITFTYSVINHAARVAFVASGKGKVDILHTVLDTPETGLPAARVRPVYPGKLYWFVDNAASEKVQYPRTPFV